MHYFCENSQPIFPNSLKVIVILADWKLPKYHIGQLIEYEANCEEKYHYQAIIRGCQYIICEEAWDYHIVDLDDSESNDRLEENQIKESQIIATVRRTEDSVRRHVAE
jgi:hypothetical protein